MIESKLLEDENSFFSANLRSSGYHFNFMRNLMVIIAIACLIALVWIITAILQIVRSKTQGEQQRSSSQTSSEVYMNNFMVRFFLEAFFELMICAFINLTSQEAGVAWWICSLAAMIISIFALLSIFSLFCMNGPYVRDTYAKNSLLASFWGPRTLHEDVLRAALTSADEKTVGLTKKESAEENVAIAVGKASGDSNT
jgi:hypothetical protein